MVETKKKAFKKFYKLLLKVLPMEEIVTTFYCSDLLPVNVKAKIESLSMRERSQYFLDEVILPGLEIDYTDQFDEMISVMKDYDDPKVRHLADRIKAFIDQDSVDRHLKSGIDITL